MMPPPPVRVHAPASVSNLGPGFDVLGLALHEPVDVVEAEWSPGAGIAIAEVTGDGGALTTDPNENVAGVAAAHVLGRVLRREGSMPTAGGPTGQAGVRLRVHKGMPLASGLGSSAASSVAGAVAANELLGRPYSRRELLESALAGETAASGSPHADNVAPSLLGGIVLIRSYHPFEILELPVPPGLWLAVVHPHCVVRTADARRLVADRSYRLDDCVANLGNLGALVTALFRGDLELLGRAIEDRLVEPVRSVLIPGLADVKEAAKAAGALGCSISGSGPSVFAVAGSRAAADEIVAAMRAAFVRSARLTSDAFVSQVNPQGATVA